MALISPTKENFLWYIQSRIDEYEAIPESDINLYPECTGALKELQCVRQHMRTMFREDSSTTKKPSNSSRKG